MKKKITIALAGNPNSGKTTIFNNLTGAHQHVGNYPGVTVERKQGRLSYKDYDIQVIDLPGTYSLSAYSPDEVVTRNVIIEEKPDLLINVVDSSNLERHLYLTAQLKELGVPIIVVMNMADMAEEQGLEIDCEQLSRLLGVGLISMVGTKNTGTRELLDLIIDAAEGKIRISDKPIRYNAYVEEQMRIISKHLEGARFSNGQNEMAAGISGAKDLNRWAAIKLLENDKEVLKKISLLAGGDTILEQAQRSRDVIENVYGEDAESSIADGRYGFIRGACQEALRYPPINRVSLTEKIDLLVLNRWLGLPIFLGVIWLLFQITFTLGAIPMDWIDAGFSILGVWAAGVVPEGLLQSLIVDGIIGGVGGVIVFLPNILLLFLGIAILEGSGYMSRAAFVMDKLMHRVGLHGKSFIPMLIGFGCNIPSIMAARTLENERDRLVTMMVSPLISCGARLPVYTLLIAAFFPASTAGTVLFSIYLIGIMMALIMAKVFRKWLLPGESEPFVMELPAYRCPTLKSVVLQMWGRAYLYLKKAGTIILAASILMWGLFAFPQYDAGGNEFESAAVHMEQSYAGKMGKMVEPIIKPLGFDWRTGIALMAGFTAKEVIVSTMGTLYKIVDQGALEEGGTQVKSFAARAREQSGYTPLTAYALMVFILLYVPCMATIAVLKRETNGWKWPAFTIVYTLTLAWAVSFMVYQGGLLLGLG